MPQQTVITSGAFSGKYFAAGVEVRGLAELSAKLRAMPTRISNKLARYATRQAATVVADRAKDIVPVRTGALQRSIRVRALKRSRRNRGKVGARVVTGQDLFKGETYYGGMVEFGTKRMGARSFLRRAAYETEDQVAGVFRAALATAIREEERKEANKVLTALGGPLIFPGPEGWW